MPTSALRRPVVRRSIIAALTLALVARAVGLQHAQARLRPGEPRSPSAGSTATSTSTTTQSLRVRTGARRRARLASAHAAARLRPAAGARRGRGRRADATPERMCAWGRASCAPHRAGAAARSRRRSPTSCSRSRRRSSRASRSASPRPTRSTATTSCSATRRSAQGRGRSARSSAPRCFYGRLDDGAARPASRTRSAASPYDAEVAYAERQRRQQDVLTLVARACANAPAGARRQVEVRAYLKRLDRSPRESYRALLGARWSTQLRAGERAAQPRQRRRSGGRRRRSSPATGPSCAR